MTRLARLPRLPLCPSFRGQSLEEGQHSTAVAVLVSHEAQKSSRTDPGDGARRRVETNDDADPLSAIVRQRLRLPYPAGPETVGYDEKSEL